MIDFAIDDDLRLAVASAQRLADEWLRPHERAHEAARGLPAALRARAREVGLERIAWPEAAGGAGLGALARVLTLEALATGDAGAALGLDMLGALAPVLVSFGGAEALGTHAAALERIEGARALLVVDLHGRLQQADGRLVGRLPWVPAERIDLLGVLGRHGCVLVGEGIALEPVRGSALHAAGAAALTLDRAPLLAQWSDAQAAAQALAAVRLEMAALMVGRMHQAAEYARRYAMERVAFGKPIAHHQALAFLIVEMRMAVDAARALLHEAAWRLDGGRPAIAAAAAAFLEAVDAGRFVGPMGVQILGAAGFMQDHPEEKAMRDLRTLAQLAGGADAARDDAWTDEPADTSVDDPERPLRLLATPL